MAKGTSPCAEQSSIVISQGFHSPVRRVHSMTNCSEKQHHASLVEQRKDLPRSELVWGEKERGINASPFAIQSPVDGHQSRRPRYKVASSTTRKEPRMGLVEHGDQSCGVSERRARSDRTRENFGSSIFQHKDNGRLPLKARNLELLSGESQSAKHGGKHGGSAALLHAARSQPTQRESLPYSTFDLEGNAKTKAFRPHRAASNEGGCSSFKRV